MSCTLNEGRAKGPATAAHEIPAVPKVGFAQRRPGERPGNRMRARYRPVDGTRAQRRPGERPGNRLVSRLLGWACTTAAQRRPGERPGNRRHELGGAGRLAARSTKAGRKARQPHLRRPATLAWIVGRSTKAGRKARQPPGVVVAAGLLDYRSTKAGRKARQPPAKTRARAPFPTTLNEGRAKGPATARTTAPPKHTVRFAQRRPGERPGNRPYAPTPTQPAPSSLNEGRAKGPATAHTGPVQAGGRNPRSTKAGRKARQPPVVQAVVVRQPEPRSTKAGRKARQPPLFGAFPARMMEPISV